MMSWVARQHLKLEQDREAPRSPSRPVDKAGEYWAEGSLVAIFLKIAPKFVDTEKGLLYL